MKHLSRIFVGTGEAAKLRISDLYVWHRMLWKSFPDMEKKDRPFLFRVDAMRGQFRILLLSSYKPHFQNWGYWETTTIDPAFLYYNSYRFELRANPTEKKVVRDNDGNKIKNGRRLGIYKEPDLYSWLENKASHSGFGIDFSEVSSVVDEFFIKDKKRGKLVRADFKGILTVTDRGEFKRAFNTGIGTAKSFGFGMLMIEPVR